MEHGPSHGSTADHDYGISVANFMFMHDMLVSSFDINAAKQMLQREHQSLLPSHQAFWVPSPKAAALVLRILSMTYSSPPQTHSRLVQPTSRRPSPPMW